MTSEEKAALKKEFPDHFFCKVVKGQGEWIIAIPKKHAGKPVQSMPGMTVDMLHGATIRLMPLN